MEDDIPLEKSTDEDAQGPTLLFSEFEVALNKLKNRKAEGLDSIPGDLLKALDSKGKQELFEIHSKIYERGEWPKEFLEFAIIPLEKKCGLSNYQSGLACLEDYVENSHSQIGK